MEDKPYYARLAQGKVAHIVKPGSFVGGIEYETKVYFWCGLSYNPLTWFGDGVDPFGKDRRGIPICQRCKDRKL